MSNPIPEVRLAEAIMNMRWAQAKRDARARSLAFYSRRQTRRGLPYEGANWLGGASVRLVTLGARLVAYGLPPHLPTKPQLMLARS